jgi:serine/threonine protein phosphatase PrpC
MPTAFFYAATDTGLVRQNNEDNILIASAFEEGLEAHSFDYPVKLDGLLAIVADGMGGAVGGELASSIAIETVASYVKSNISKDLSTHHIIELLKNAILHAHRAILLETSKKPTLSGMGTTLVVTYFTQKYILTAWIGDSRLYRYLNIHERDVPSFIPASSTGHLHQITHDHSMVWEQVKLGLLSPEDARLSTMSNIITQSVGDPLQTPKPDSSILPLIPGDLFLLCSDGLCGMISNETIANTFHDLEGENLETIGQKLMLLAKQAGGHDNISLILVKPEKLTTPLSAKDSNILSTTQKTVLVTSLKNNKKKYRFLLLALIVLLLLAGLWTTNIILKPQKVTLPVVDTFALKAPDTTTNPILIEMDSNEQQNTEPVPSLDSSNEKSK